MAKGKQKRQPVHRSESSEALSASDANTSSSSISTSSPMIRNRNLDHNGDADHTESPRLGSREVGGHGPAETRFAAAVGTVIESGNVSPEPVKLLVDEQPVKKWGNAAVRSTWTALMIGGFLAVLMAGHVSVILLVGLIQTLVYREVISIGVVPTREKKLPWNRSLHWYFLLSTNYFLYGESIIHYFKASVIVDAFLMPLATHHRFISFSLYCLGLVLFVMSLKKGQYKFQFSHFGWTHMCLLLVVCTSHFIINNIIEGLLWFVLPISLVVCNDITAYVCGFFWGRTPLIQLSPKKTWEGFIGALICTVVFGFFFSGYIAQFPYMYCPVDSFRKTSMSDIDCVRNQVFDLTEYRLPIIVTGLLRHLLFWRSAPKVIALYPVQLHSIGMSLFASVVAPFGGFFASGFKRAFKIKDFGDSIPGHGGMTDRMDCQFLMGLFSYMYYQSFIGAVKVYTVGSMLELIIRQQSMSVEDVGELVEGLREYLMGQGAPDPCRIAL